MPICRASLVRCASWTRISPLTSWLLEKRGQYATCHAMWCCAAKRVALLSFASPCFYLGEFVLNRFALLSCALLCFALHRLALRCRAFPVHFIETRCIGVHCVVFFVCAGLLFRGVGRPRGTGGGFIEQRGRSFREPFLGEHRAFEANHER